MQIRKLLIPTDFSDLSQHALDYAIGLARALNAAVELLHVHHAPALSLQDGDLSMPVDPTLEAEYEASVQRRLDEVVEKYRASGAPISGRLLSGVPHAEIVRAAEEGGADLIVMGTHGRTGLAHLLMGSVAERVARSSPIPVLTVPSAERARPVH
ncbi:MAG: universal stress protein [Gammaproteobacteria bacterium]